jgi:hypothetical protein
MKKLNRALTIASTAVVFSLGGVAAIAQVPPPPASRTPQPFPDPSTYVYTVSPDGMTTHISTPTGKFPASDPWVNPTNLLPTRYENVKAADGTEIPNTLPSTPQHPYNLHPDPVVTPIDKTSPTDDLAAIFKSWRKKIHHDEGDKDDDRKPYSPAKFNLADVQRAIDILEGNPAPNRVYSGIPMIHYNGPNKVKKVQPIKDANGKVIGGNVDVHQIWFDTHIESDTAFIDPSDVLNVPFTVTYTLDTLNKGKDDFSPMQMYLDTTAVPGMAIPLVTMDLTFFPMEEGTRTVMPLSFAPGKNFNLTYNWGWRRHPPRVQVAENALKVAMGKTLVKWETDTFGVDPRASQEAKEAAIGMISDLAPSKRMWKAFRALLKSGFNPILIAQAERAFDQWQDRNSLPDGVTADPNADITLFYADNTIYGHMKGYVVNSNAQPVLEKWHMRGTTVTIKLINGDYFPHAYVNVDFGGMRGWENTFQNTLPVGGDGTFFTFGRAWWEMNTPNPILVPAATPAAATTKPLPGPALAMDDPKIYEHKELWQRELDPEGKTLPKSKKHPTMPAPTGETLGEHTVVLTLNYEPSLRLRLYQFDPLHHEQAIWSVH